MFVFMWKDFKNKLFSEKCNGENGLYCLFFNKMFCKYYIYNVIYVSVCIMIFLWKEVNCYIYGEGLKRSQAILSFFG